jgi:hypothetical protein
MILSKVTNKNRPDPLGSPGGVGPVTGGVNSAGHGDPIRRFVD